MIRFPLRRCDPVWIAILLIGISASGGCSKEELQTMTSTVQQKAKEAIADVKELPVVSEVLPAKGSAKVQLSPPVDIQTAYVRFFPIGDGRPSVVQWTSYEPEKGPNTYPALLVRATTSASSLDQAIGQTLPGEIYFQMSPDAPVLCLPMGSFIDLAVARSATDTNLVAASVAAGQLFDPSGTVHPLSGITIEGVLP